MSNQDITPDTYDRGIVPAETAARIEREGDLYKQVPEQDEADKAAGDIDTTGGYTVDKEGLVNNYAVEPEMYYEVPGDLRAQEEALAAERAQEMAEVNENDETGKLTADGDQRGKGPGVI
ncbi:MAG: hypothetical protein KME15_17230 [Drouetiella hepatica Uher 2000/2452]|uniref:Uncharacterized protein n=1 Tax=Drouetiella hepatica Uher 2000/2452 TaxID=904376 RepID=A0A951QCT4_9CYAN|nr:hypothetical protein [Drouetiella hepatica Uher 2000/2452]